MKKPRGFGVSSYVGSRCAQYRVRFRTRLTYILLSVAYSPTSKSHLVHISPSQAAQDVHEHRGHTNTNLLGTSIVALATVSWMLQIDKTRANGFFTAFHQLAI